MVSVRKIPCQRRVVPPDGSFDERNGESVVRLYAQGQRQRRADDSTPLWAQGFDAARSPAASR